MIAQLIGYLASLLLAISLLVNNDLKFRWLNTLGCAAFIGYGIMINAFPVLLTNVILLLINAFYLVKIYRRNEDFDLVEFRPGDPLIDKFLSFHQADIKKYFPGFDPLEPGGHISFIVLRDMAIANIFVASMLDDGTAVIRLNYTVPKFRDYKVGKFLFYKEKQLLLSRGIKRLVYSEVFNKQHEGYLLKMGFRKEPVNDSFYYYLAIG